MAVEQLIMAPSPVNTCPWTKNHQRLCTPDTIFQTCLIVRQAWEQGKKGGLVKIKLTGERGPIWEKPVWNGYMDRSNTCATQSCPLIGSVRTILTNITDQKINANELV